MESVEGIVMSKDSDSVTTLLPCPFCGGEAISFRWDDHYGCKNEWCGGYAANLTIDQWNQRDPQHKTEPQMTDPLEEARKVIEFYASGKVVSFLGTAIEGFGELPDGRIGIPVGTKAREWLERNKND